MPALKFIIDGDDAPLRKKLQDLQNLSAKSGGSAARVVSPENAKAIEVETNERLKNVQAINEQAAAEANLRAAASVAPKRVTEISDSVAEVEAYKAGLVGLQNGSIVIDKLKAEISELLAAQDLLNEQVATGAITQETYNAASQANANELARLQRNIETVNQSFAQNVVVQREAAAAAEATSTATVDEIGLLENLKIVLADLKAQKLAIVDPLTVEADRAQLTRLNALIQETEAEMRRLNNVGKVGFDEQGNAIRRTTATVDPFGRAISRATNLSAIGARVVTQLTRQIVGLGVGMLSFAIGAKAIEYIVEWVKNLDMFSGRLDQAKHDMEAFNEVQKDTAESSAKEVTSLKILYEAATDVTNSMQKRLEAAQKIKAEYPASFANSTTQAILNGKEKDSYDQLTKSLLDAAAAQAALDKISKLYATVQEQEYQKQKIRIGTETENARIRATGNASLIGGGTGISGGQTSQQIDTKATIAANNKAAAAQIKELEENQQVALRTINFLKTYAGGAKSLADTLTGTNKLIQDPLKNFDTIIKNASDESDLLNLKKALEAKMKALAPDDKQIAIYQEKIKQVEKALKQYNPKLTDGNDQKTALDSLLQSQIAIQQKINEFKNKNAQAALTPDQSSLTQISDQFKAVRFQIDQANAKYDAFVKKFGIAGLNAYNSNPANKVKLTKTDTSFLKSDENSAIDTQALANENKFIQDDIEKKKKLYADYEDFKTKAGSKAADAEYSDLLKSGKNFSDYLNNIYSSFGNTDMSGPIQERRDVVKKALEGNSEDQKKAFQDLLIQSATYETQRKYIIQSGIDDEKKLRDAGFTDQANQVAKNTKDQLDALDVSNFKNLDSYKSLFDNIDTMSTASAKRQIENLEHLATIMLGTGKIGAKAYLDIIKSLDSANKSVNDKLPQGLKEIGSSISDLGSKVNDFDEGFSNVLKTAGSLLSSLGEIKSTINTLNSSSSSSFDKVSAGFGFIGAIWSATASLEEYFLQEGQKERDAAYKYQKEVDAIDAVNKALERQISLTKQLYGGDLVSGYLSDLNDLTAAQEKNQKALDGKLALTGNHTLDLEIGMHNNGLGLFDLEINKLVQLGKISELSKLSIEQLNQLLDKKLLDDKSAAIVQSMIDLDQQIKDTQNALNETLTGTSFDSLLDSIVSLFQNATTSAEDFGKSFQKIIQDSLLNSFKRDYLGKQLQGFYDDLADLTKAHGTLTKDDISKLQEEYNTIITDANNQFQALQNATGVKFGDTQSQDSALNKSIKSITSDQANALEGIERGQYDYIKKIYDLMAMSNANSDKYYDVVATGLRNWQAIEFNTGQTVVQLQLAVAELKGININTKSTTSLRGAGLA